MSLQNFEVCLTTQAEEEVLRAVTVDQRLTDQAKDMLPELQGLERLPGQHFGVQES